MSAQAPSIGFAPITEQPQAPYPPQQQPYPPQQNLYPNMDKDGQMPLVGQPGYPPQNQGMAMTYGAPQGYGAPPPQGYGPPAVQGYGPPPPQGYGAPPAPGYGYAPQQGAWMSIPQGIPSCPPGLEYLTQIDQLLVHQKVELLEAFTGFETNNKYTIKNSLGQKVYWAVEDTDCCTRMCCGPARPFNMQIFDFQRHEVMHLYRPLRCTSCCCFCCLQIMEVSSPPGTVIGTVEQNWSLFKPNFSLKNAEGETVLKIVGPFCTFSICGDVEFSVQTRDGTEVGKISKQWTGLVKEMFTDADNFGITFPMDLDVKMKAVVMGALFLIDYMFFEKKANQENDRPGML